MTARFTTDGKYIGDAAKMTIDDGVEFVQRQREYIEPKLYAKKYRDIIYQDIVPVSNEAGPWAAAITYETLDQRTKARFMASGSGEMPLADISMGRETMSVEHAGLGYRYSLQELRESAHLGRDLDTRRAEAVRRGTEELAQETCLLGSTPHGLPGLLNNTDVPAASAAVGTWSAATTDNIIDDVNDLIESVYTQSNGIELPDTVLIPTAQFALLSRRLVGTEHVRSLYQILLEQNLYYTETGGSKLMIKPLAELAGAGAGSTDRMMAYRRDTDVLTFHFPMPLQFVAPQPVLLDVIVPGEFRLSGTEIRYPGACGYSDGI